MEERYKMDSKMICAYFGAVTKEEIRWEKYVITPKPLIVSEMVFRGFTCPANCGACCTQVSATVDGNTLNYLPHEECPGAVAENVLLNDRSFLIMTEGMRPTSHVLPILEHHYPCKHLTLDARCGIYQRRSLACDLPLLQVTQKKNHNYISVRKFGRHHLYTQFDMKTKGAMCELLEITPESTQDTRRRLNRLKEWTDYFQLSTWLPEIIEWANREPIPTQRLCLGF